MACRIKERAAKQLRGNANIKGGGFQRDCPLRVPSHPTVERAIEGDQVIFVIIPGRINFAVGADKRHRPNALARAGGVVNARDRKSRSSVGGASEVDAAVGGVASSGGVPSHVNTITERASWIGIGGNHRLVIEMI